LAENKRYDRIKEITDQLEQGIQELFDSERYKTWLTTMSRFHDYSLNNTLLIALQKPDATLVAGYSTWKNQFGRQVQKGEKAIRILAPTPYKQRIEKEKLDPDTRMPLRDKDGKPVTETQEILHTAFKVVNVFDVSQTEGRDLPTLGVDELSGEVRDFDLFFEALKRVCPVPIELTKIEGGAKGYFHLQENRIAIKKGMSQLQTAKTAVHEMAHQKLHSLKQQGEKKEGSRLTRNAKEVEAESVAFTVCQRFGLDTSDYSFAYIAGWSQGKDTPELKASLRTIRQASAELIDAIEEQMQLLQKEQEFQPVHPEYEKEQELSADAKITFYVAECMEFPELGEFHENLTLPEAFAIYNSIPAERMHGVKGIGFDLKDGSIYEGQFPLMEAGKLSTDSIELVKHYRESPLVQQAVADCRSLLEEKEQQAVLDAADGVRTPAAKSDGKRSVLTDLRNKKSRVHGVNASKEQNRSKREEMEQA
jgi:hypothetical protein